MVSKVGKNRLTPSTSLSAVVKTQNKQAICFDDDVVVNPHHKLSEYTLVPFLMILLQAAAMVIDLISLQWNLFQYCRSLTSKWTNNDLHVQLHPLLHWRPELPTLKGQVDIVYVGVYLVLTDIWAFLEENKIEYCYNFFSDQTLSIIYQDGQDLHLLHLLVRLISVDYFPWPQWDSRD